MRARAKDPDDDLLAEYDFSALKGGRAGWGGLKHYALRAGILGPLRGSAEAAQTEACRRSVEPLELAW